MQYIDINFEDKAKQLPDLRNIDPESKPHCPASICDFVKSCVATVLRISLNKLNAPTRLSAEVAFARQTAMYLAHTSLGLSFADIAAEFKRDRTTVAHACQVVEDRRDDTEVDFIITCLERAISEWVALASYERPIFQGQELLT